MRVTRIVVLAHKYCQDNRSRGEQGKSLKQKKFTTSAGALTATRRRHGLKVTSEPLWTPPRNSCTVQLLPLCEEASINAVTPFVRRILRRRYASGHRNLQ